MSELSRGGAAAPEAKIGTPLLLTLGLLSAIGPFALDLYLPAFPGLVSDLHTTAAGAQLTLTGCLAGLAIGQLVIGPISDRIGRRTPLLIGMAVCLIASAIAALAPTIAVLLVARLVQGLAGSAGPVISRAVIADRATGAAAARALTLVTLVIGVAPAVAPLVGSVFATSLGWRGLLGVVFVLVCAMLLVATCVVRESLPAERRATTLLPAQAANLRSIPFLANACVVGAAFGAMLAYIAASPFLFQDVMGVNALTYGGLFGLNALALAAVSAISARLARSRRIRTLVGIGLSMMGVAAVGFAVLIASSTPPLTLEVPLFLLVGALGLVIGNGTALALAAVPDSAGSASALIGALQFGIGALVSPLVGLAGNESVTPLAVVMVSCVALAGAIHAIERRTSGESHDPG